MEATCHRCHQYLPADSSFCPHCGAAQLFVTTEQVEEEAAAAGLPGVQRVQRIDWKRALHSVLLIAGVSFVLSGISSVAWTADPISGKGFIFGAMNVASFLWILTASTTTLWFYLRPAPNRPMDGRIGARIGLVVGLAISVLTSFSNAASMVLQRYVFHRGEVIDAQFTAIVTQLAEFYNRMGIDQKTQQMVFSLIKSPEGHAGQMLSTYGSRAVEITLFLMLTGAISGMARKARSRRAAQ